MRIEPFELPLRRPLETATGAIEHREGFVVAVEHAGVEGVGEATPLPGWTESTANCREALQRAGEIAEHLDWGIALARTDAPAARHGLSLALADARATAAEEPLYRSLGAEHTVRQIPVNATVGDGSPSETAERAREAVASGVPCVKVKVGSRTLETDLDRVRAVHDAVADRARIRVDVNGSWDLEGARDALDTLADFGVTYVEQPLPPEDFEGLRALRGGDVGVAVDETLAQFDLERVIDEEAADVAVVKPMVQGGPDRAAELAQHALEAGIDPVVSTTVDAVVARTAAVHVAATIPEVAPCGLATAEFLAEDLGTDPAPVEDGAVYVPQDKGLGLAERPSIP